MFHCLVRMTNDVANSLDKHVLERRLCESWPGREWRDTHIVLGVSGGADSVAMLRAMAALKGRNGGRGRLYVAHLNHGLRGSAADADEAWVRLLCQRLGLVLEVKRAEIGAIAAEQGDGWEAAARLARYGFLRSVGEKVGARFVVTAHTANDQVETVLHRILRGTGIEGLAGIAKARPLTASMALVRPMLEFTRQEVLDYLAVIEQDYRTDSTNDNIQWTRNRLRHELLPHLRERYNARLDDSLMRLAVQAREMHELISGVAMTIAADCVAADSLGVKIDCGKLQDHPAIVVREVFKIAWRQAGWPERAMGFDQWQQLAALTDTNGSRVLNLPGNIRVKREGQFMVFEPLAGKSGFA